MKHKLLIMSSVLALFGTLSCNQSGNFVLNRTSVNLAIGETTTLKATVNGNKHTVKYTSSNEDVANVDETTGTITPINGGSATITATDDNGKSATCEVNIRMKTILIGVDGAGDFFNSNYCPKIWDIFFNSKTNSAVTKSKGCLTSNPTISAQCWGSMLTGVSPEVHKFTNDTISIIPNVSHPSIFYEAATQIPSVKLASFVNWKPINTGIVENGIGVDKREHMGESDEPLRDEIVSYLEKNEPDLLYVQFDSVDHAGHTHEYGSEEYYEQLKVVDSYIGDIYKTLNDRDVLKKYDFIVTADHGGINKDHGGLSDQEKYTFFAISGDNIKKHDDRRVIENMNVIDISAVLAHCLAIKNNSDWGKGIEGGIKIPDNIFIN